MDDWAGYLKIISMLIAGLFGILGLATEYKDENRKITPWGKVALGGILLSTLLSFALHYREAAIAKEAAKAAERDATKREREAQVFANSLESLLGKAQDGLQAQHEALNQLETVRGDAQATLKGQEKNLVQTEHVSKGLSTTLQQQSNLLKGQEQTTASQLQQIKLQEKVLDESRRLYLAQYKLSGIEISWQLSPDVIQKMKEHFDARHPTTKAPLFRDAAYLKGAVTAGGSLQENKLGITLDRNNQPKLVWSLRRPMGLAGGEYALNSPEGKAFLDALSVAIPQFFYVKVEPAAVIVEMDQSLYPPQIKISGGRIFFTIDNPDVKLSQLQNVIFTLQAFEYDGNPPIAKKIRIRLLDDKVDFDSELPLDWQTCATKKIIFEPDEGTAFQEGVCATTAPTSANFDRLLNPLQVAQTEN